MDSHEFDRFTVALARLISRRQLFRGTFAAIVALFVTGGRPALAGPCPIGEIDCGSTTCVDPMTDNANCGGCGHACPLFSHCVDGTCVPNLIVCLYPLTACGDTCVDTSTDPANCGGCGITCSDDEFCLMGGCAPRLVVCLAPDVACDGECVDLNTSFAHCGACGNACPAVQDAVCCDGVCARLFSDPYNCGACGNVCPEGSTCVQSGAPPNGVCVCNDGLTMCAGYCGDLLWDPYNCGDCGVVCPAGTVCASGVCESNVTAVPTATTEPTKSPEPTATPEPTTVPEPAKIRHWTGRSRLHGAYLLQRNVEPGDDPIAMGDGQVGPIYTSSDLARLAALGATYVTIAHPAIVDANDPRRIDAALRDNLRGLTRRAIEAGLHVVVSLRTGPGLDEAARQSHVVCQSGGCLPGDTTPLMLEDDAPIWTRDSDLDGWAVAWAEIARMFRDYSSVIGYELMTSPTPPARTVWKSFCERMIDAIRAEDSLTPVLVNAPGLPERGLATRVTDDRYAVHTVDWFAPERFVLQEFDEPRPLTYPGRFDSTLDETSGAFDAEWMSTQFAPVPDFVASYDMPVAVGAFGLPRWQPGAADYLDDQLRLFDTLGLNSALWFWYPAAWSVAGDGYDITRGPDPTVHDTVENDLLAVVRKRWAAA